MHLIDLLTKKQPTPQQAPAIESVRPCECHKCGGIAGAGIVLLFHGHGIREVTLILPGANWMGEARLVTVEVRRFKCKNCGAVVMVLPPGMVRGYLYSLVAILATWFRSIPPPVGEGLDDESVHARQGVERWPSGKEDHRTGKRRWRSLARWAGKIGEWWPGRAVTGATWRARVASLLAGFAAEASEAGIAGVVARGVASHAGAGAAM